MDSNNFKDNTRHSLGLAFVLVSLSAITVFAAMVSIDMLDKPNFEISTWLGVAMLLLAIVCAWRVTLNNMASQDETSQGATRSAADELEHSFNVRARDEFGELMQ